MKTDELFYALFKLDPHSLFQLVQLEIEGEYTFESISTKTTEKRVDGFFKRVDGKGPHIFLEVQGYHDPKIYWRLFREICTYYEQTDTDAPFIGIVLFLEQKYDPGLPLLTSVPPAQLIRANLIDCLNAVWDRAGALTVLKPLALPDNAELSDAVRQWKEELTSLHLPVDKFQQLIELLEYVILQCFPSLPFKEVQIMLQLTPLEKTVAGKELIQIGVERGLVKGMEKGLEQGLQKGKRMGLQEGIEKGISKGMDKGELIGEIRLAQRILKRPVTPRKTLAEKTLKALKEEFQELETALESLATTM